jgi:hypothetical protein
MNRWPGAMATVSALGLVWTLTGEADAATIYGTIREGGQPLPNVGVELTCGGPGIPPQQTDARGTYRFIVGRTGRCELRVQGATAPVTLYDDPTRYDFEMRQEGGRRRLIRQ